MEETVEIIAFASGTALTYQWQRNEVDLVDIPPKITGATSTWLIVERVEENDEASYRCVVRNGNTSASVAIFGPIQLTVCKYI